MKKLIILLFLFVSSAYSFDFKSEERNFKQDFVYTSSDSPIWGFDFLDEENILFTEKDGSLKLLNLKTKKVQLIKDDFERLDPSGQGGLLDILVEKKESSNNLFITYSFRKDSKKTTALFKAKFKDNKLSGEKIIYKANAYELTSHHFGSRLVIKDNELYMTIGDRGKRDKAQTKEFDNGSILKFSLKDYSHKIFSIGHRNPQGITLNPLNNNIINGEFGPKGGDELNLVLENHNYGWPVITYGEEYIGGKIGKKEKDGLDQPLIYWVPSISFSGINFYTHTKIKEWRNNLFLACLGSQHLRRIVIDKDNKVLKQEVLLKKLKERIRMVRTSPSGDLYFSTDSGKLGVITYK